jgi:hypothetical protein
MRRPGVAAQALIVSLLVGVLAGCAGGALPWHLPSAGKGVDQRVIRVRSSQESARWLVCAEPRRDIAWQLTFADRRPGELRPGDPLNWSDDPRIPPFELLHRGLYVMCLAHQGGQVPAEAYRAALRGFPGLLILATGAVRAVEMTRDHGEVAAARDLAEALRQDETLRRVCSAALDLDVSTAWSGPAAGETSRDYCRGLGGETISPSGTPGDRHFEEGA